MCRLAGVSRAGYYRHWRQSAPRQEETGLRDVFKGWPWPTGTMAIAGSAPFLAARVGR